MRKASLCYTPVAATSLSETNGRGENVAVDRQRLELVARWYLGLAFASQGMQAYARYQDEKSDFAASGWVAKLEDATLELKEGYQLVGAEKQISPPPDSDAEPLT